MNVRPEIPRPGDSERGLLRGRVRGQQTFWM